MASPAIENGDKTQIIQDDPKMEDRTSKVIIVVVGITCAVTVVALILACVGLSNGGGNIFNVSTGDSSSSSSTGSASGQTSSNSGDDRIWMLQIGHFGANTQYLDEASGTIRGYDVDVVNAVCQLAFKNCRIVWDLYERCWDSQAGQRPRGGIGLMGSSYYDACVGWYNTLDRARTFAFTKPMEKAHPVAFFKKTGNSFNWPNFDGLTVGFLDGWWIDEQCLARYQVNGFNPADLSSVIHYPSEEAAANALINNQIDVAFLPVVSYLREFTGINIAHTPMEDKCANSGPGLMLAKDQTELMSWWNEAFDRLTTTSEYTSICNNLQEEHGGQPGENPEDICVTF